MPATTVRVPSLFRSYISACPASSLPTCVADVVKFNATKLLSGQWDPYPIDMYFHPPCVTVSSIGLARPGVVLDVSRAALQPDASADWQEESSGLVHHGAWVVAF